MEAIVAGEIGFEVEHRNPAPGGGPTLRVRDLVRNREVFRFDCFDEEPHYHYVDWKGQSNDMVRIDPIADGDPLTWALDRIRTRLPQMLRRAGAGEVTPHIDSTAIEAILPRVSEAAYRARYEHDDQATLRGALGEGNS